MDEISPDSLVIRIDPGSAPAEEIATLLVDMSRLYRLCGGSGLHFRPGPGTIHEDK